MRSNKINNNNNNKTVHSVGGLSKETLDLSTYDKLMLYFTKTYKQYNLDDFTDALYKFRKEKQTLTGLSLTDIEEGILNIIQKKYPTDTVEVNIDSTEDRIEQTVAAALWSTFKRYREREQIDKKQKNNNNDETSDEEQCLICFEELNSKKTESFSCNHIFHRVCLEEWFKIERTCPLCRQMLLFHDEFPMLK